MVRRLLPSIAIVAVFAAATVAAEGQGQAPVSFSFRDETAFAVINVSRDGRALRLLPMGDGCAVQPRVRVRETRGLVRLRVSHLRLIEGSEQFACDLYQPGPSYVIAKLKAPVGGRRLVGSPAYRGRDLYVVPTFPEDDSLRGIDERRVPRVRGLATLDAAAVLDAQGFRVRLQATKSLNGTQVVSQTPRPGATAINHSTVTIRAR